MDDTNPPFLDASPRVPLRRIYIIEPKPSFQGGPNPFSEPTFKEEVHRRFLHLVAKLALPTILPPPPLKPIRRPNSVLKDQPREDFALGRRPWLPNQRRHRGGSLPQELHVVGRRRGIIAILGELPSYFVRCRRVKLDILKRSPKGDELRNMFNGETILQV